MPESVPALQEKLKNAISRPKAITAGVTRPLQTVAERRNLEKSIEIAEELHSNATTLVGSLDGSVFQQDKAQGGEERSVRLPENEQTSRIWKWIGNRTMSGERNPLKSTQ